MKHSVPCLWLDDSNNGLRCYLSDRNISCKECDNCVEYINDDRAVEWYEIITSRLGIK